MQLFNQLKGFSDIYPEGRKLELDYHKKEIQCLRSLCIETDATLSSILLEMFGF